MKKNRMMRLASCLLVAVLLTTCVISGTYAKYTTTAKGGDSARVAKFGVTVGSSGTLFSDQYTTDDTTAAGITYSVTASNKTDSASGDKLVAPGTKNTEGITFTLTGTPEVAVKVEVTVAGEGETSTNKDVFLKKTDDQTAYRNYTGVGDEKFTVQEDYHPLKFTLKSGNAVISYTKTGETEAKKLEKVSLSEIEAYLKSLSGSYGPNTNLATIGGNSNNGAYTLTWEWEFDDEGHTHDKEDTLLGNLAADSTIEAKTTDNGAKWSTMTDGTDYSNNVELKVSIMVTQID